MSLLSNIILWTVSLLLAVLGILFGFLASINSRKANMSIENIINNRGIEEDARKYFFDKMKSTVAANKKSMKALEKENITYFDYSIVTIRTRFPFIDSQAIEKFKKSDYINVINTFLDGKRELDKEFVESVDGLQKLNSDKHISVQRKENLKKYHAKVIVQASQIIKDFTIISKDA